MTRVIRWLRRAAWSFALTIGLTGAAVLYFPLRVTIDDVSNQPLTPLPEAFRVALRFSLSADGSPWRVRSQAARLIAPRGPQDGIMRLVDPLFVAIRLAAFTDITQSEHFVAQSYRPRCWTRGYADLTVPEALYLAARMQIPSSDDEVRTRTAMTRIAQRIAASDAKLAPAFIAAANGPLPICD
jgi:hypothetical protein